MGRLASHVVGFTSVDNRGIEGIEYAFDRDLRGKGAMHTFLVDVHRRPLGFCLQDEQDNEMPMHGSGIILTLDATIQQFVREALLKQYKEFQAEGGRRPSWRTRRPGRSWRWSRCRTTIPPTPATPTRTSS